MVSNAKRGADFEKMVEEELKKFLPNSVINRIDRAGSLKYESTSDIEIADRMELVIDCKQTIGQFGFSDLRKLLKIVQKKYCLVGDIPVVIFGERRGKTRINRDNIGVALMQGKGVVVFSLETFCEVLKKFEDLEYALLLTPDRICGA